MHFLMVLFCSAGCIQAMSHMVNHFQGLAGPEGHETSTVAAVVREPVQCTESTYNENYEDSVYTSCEEEKYYNKEKSELVL